MCINFCDRSVGALSTQLAKMAGHGYGLKADRRLARKIRAWKAWHLSWSSSHPKGAILVEIRDDAARLCGVKPTGFQFGLSTRHVHLAELPDAPPKGVRFAKAYFDRTENYANCWVREPS